MHALKQLPNIKHRRRRDLNEKIWAERRAAELSRTRGQTYGSGIAFPDPTTAKRTPKTVGVHTTVCGACGLTGHLRKSNKLCPLNKKNVGGQKKFSNRENNAKQSTYACQPTQTHPLSDTREDT